MILRKPFAILIKYFRLIHVLLAALMFYLLYRTSSISSFISEYIGSSQTTIKDNVIDTLFGPIFFVLVIFIIIFTLIILSLMSFKRKPIKFYLYNIFTYIFSTVIYVVAYYTIQKLQYGLLEMKTLKLIQDLLTATLLFQVLAVIIVVIRATGFDIKRFNFAEDLAELDIDEKDNEEFEVDLDVDTDKLMRKIRKRFRYIRYVYIENKFFINILSLSFIAISLLFMYLNIDVYSKTYTKYETFKTNQFIIGTRESYITKYDYQKNIIEDGYSFVITRINIKRFWPRKISLVTGRIALKTNGKLYYHTVDYNEKFLDLGKTYFKEVIPNNEFSSYVLVFKIKNEDITNKMQLRYTDTTNDVAKVKIVPISLNKDYEDSKASLGEELIFEKSVLKKTTLKIDSFEMADSFKIDYNYCGDSNNCYNSIEYINLSASDNYDKTILKLVGSINYDKTLPISIPNDLYRFIDYFGKIKYRIGEETRVMNLKLREIKPRKTNLDNINYIEISKSIKNADSIVLEFNIRNRVYNYILK